MAYNHTQQGYLILSVLCLLTLFFVFISTIVDFGFGILFIVFLVLFILMSFSSLTVRIDKKMLKVWFGYGLIGRNFALKDIVSVKTVKNKWYYGWGIRYSFGLRPYRVIYNVSGFDAVEIKMKNGRFYRIGTDEPSKLKREISKAIR